MVANLQYLRRRLETSQGTGLVIIASCLGVLVAFGIWLYRSAIEFFHAYLNVGAVDTLSSVFGVFSIAVVLGASGFVVGLIMDHFVGKERHHGVAGVVEAVALSGGRLPYAKLPFKALSSALSLGAGASCGPEDPSVQIGANAGSWIGRMLNMREDTLRLLVAAGAAGGVAAAFKAPIAGVFFALEVILNGAFGASSISAVVICSVVASAMTSALDPGVEMGPFNYQLGGPLELGLFLPLGLATAAIAVAYVRGVYWQHDFWGHHIQLSRPLRTALAGVIVGLVGIALPQVLGIGREPMNEVLEGVADFGFLFLLLLFVAKIFTNIISIAGGFVGGVFAPSLFAGTMLGAAYGEFVDRIFGVQVGDPQAYAIAGMAGMLAGVLRAPITAIMLVFELTNDYRLILPIMLTTIVCVVVADRIEEHGIYSMGLMRQGIRLQPGREIDMMQGVSVAEAMVVPPPTILETATLLELRDLLRAQHTNSICVLDAQGRNLAGMVTLSDLQQAHEKPDSALYTVGDICSRDLVIAHPEDDLWTAIKTMGARDVGRLPVVKRGTSEVIGLISRHGVVRAYNIAIARKVQDQHIAERIRLNTLTGSHVFEMTIYEGAPTAEQQIKDIRWPAECVVASITRHGRLMVPHGSTILHAGDILSLVADPRVEGELMSLTGTRSVGPSHH